MTTNGKQISPAPYFDTLHYEGFKVSWADSFSPNRICFGSEDGKLKFVDDDGVKLVGSIKSVSESEEAINGLASIGNCQAVSTRADVTFMWDMFTGSSNEAKSATVHDGAHGVVATRQGLFIAPVGQRGLMLFRPSDKTGQVVLLTSDTENDLYFYRSIVLPNAEGNEVIVSAVRRGGITAGILTNDLQNHLVYTITPKDVDVVDVCGLGQSLSVAALGKNGTLILFRDIINDRDPFTFKFNAIEGVAYRVMSSRGHIFVLTSKGLYVLANFANRFLNGETMRNGVTQILPLPMTAVDANVHEDKHILVVTDKSDVLRVNIALIEQEIPQSHDMHEMARIPTLPKRGRATFERKTQNSLAFA